MNGESEEASRNREWARRLGKAIHIPYVPKESEIDKLYKEWLDVWHELTKPEQGTQAHVCDHPLHTAGCLACATLKEAPAPTGEDPENYTDEENLCMTDVHEDAIHGVNCEW